MFKLETRETRNTNGIEMLKGKLYEGRNMNFLDWKQKNIR